jgi:lipopolysaccharide/colanic/teichoic acid biosynthesis glycosyltransferase
MEVKPLLIDMESPSRDMADRRLSKEAVRRRVRSRKKAARRHRRLLPRLVRPSRYGWYARGKAPLEYAIALVLSILAAPLIVLSALAVKLTSRGPAFYTQTRVGRNGRLFTIYKIRTMVHECESLTGPRWSIPGDPRITRMGHILRKTHLDELPQLYNVLRGDMGLIGPRPERPEFLPRLERLLPQYRERLAVRPGITGLAQVHFAADTDVESVRRKLSYDLHYIRNIGLGFDLRILLATAIYGLGNPKGMSRRIAAVPADTVEECRILSERMVEEPVRVRRCA